MIPDGFDGSFFAPNLLSWFKSNKRELPWKENKDPYRIWVSEIILQQTRVVQGTPYYLKFIEAFPTIFDLAKTNEDQLMQVWQGLGYYSRARNMHHTARYIVSEYNGIFPDEYNKLLELKGIGPYTAAAISSFAFDRAIPVVDGNVIRVISRIFGINIPFDTHSGKNLFSEIANQIIDQKEPAEYNQAIMDFGATQCTPKNPKCPQCNMRKNCFAFSNDKVELLPAKKKKLIRKNRYFAYFFIQLPNDQTILKKRVKKDIWQGLFEFPHIEMESLSNISLDELKTRFSELGIVDNGEIEFLCEYRQSLTHQNIFAHFYSLKSATIKSDLQNLFYLVDYKNLCNFAFPKLIDWFIEKKILPLRE